MARRHCATDVVVWINDWVWTYDPRLVGDDESQYLPFDLFPRQVEYLRWLEQMEAQRVEAVAEKSRDVGVTWLNVAFAVHRWLFHPGKSIKFGANAEETVDAIGDPDSIFEKQRLLLKRLPRWMLPRGFAPERHDNFRRLINPENGNTIRGQVGDNMGRGGRSTIYFVDEGAHVARAESVESAISGNAECRIWVSSVNGPGNVFARKRFRLGTEHPERVFTFHWRDDPRKTEEWAQNKQREFTDPSRWAAEYDIDYHASVEGTIVLAKWVRASQELRRKLDINPAGDVRGGLDIGAGGNKTVFVARRGPLVQEPEVRSEPDSMETGFWALDQCHAAGCKLLMYDRGGGFGGGPASVFKRQDRDRAEYVATHGIEAGDTPTDRRWPDGSSSTALFANLKAELWWVVRTALQRTYEHWLFLTGQEGGQEHDVSDLLLLPDDPSLSTQLAIPKFFRNEKGKIRVESKDQLRGRGVESPDHADALVLTYAGPEKVRFDDDNLGFGQQYAAATELDI